MTYFQAQAGKLQEMIDRVRELHVMVTDEGFGQCEACRSFYEIRKSWPCPTIKALDGDTIEVLGVEQS
jgi:hypothetical protein